MTNLFVCSILIMVLAIPSTVSGGLIEDTCKAVSQGSPSVGYDFCVSAFHEAPNSWAAKSTVELGLIAIEQLQKNVSNSLATVKKILADPNTSPFWKQCLDDCFDEAVRSAKEAITEYKAKKYLSVSPKLAFVILDAQGCEGGFRYACGANPFPLSTNKDHAIILSVLSLYITNQVKG